MPRVLVVVDDPALLPDGPAGLEVRAAPAFLAGAGEVPEGALVVNLCRDRRYLGTGWYVSLLGEARGGVALPEAALLEQATDRGSRDRALREEGVDVLSPQEVAARLRLAADQQPAGGAVPVPEGVALVVDDPDAPAPRLPRPDEQLSVRIVAGRALGEDPARVARRAFAAWPLPLLEARLVRDGGRWRLVSLEPLALEELTDGERARVPGLLARLARPPEAAAHARSLAVLWDGGDPTCASSSETLDRLARVGARLGLRVERLAPADLDRLSEHDGLLIRTLTGVDQPAWAWATRAEGLGMPVIDHPDAIVRCSNKVFLHELLRRAGLPTPPTRVFGAETGFDALAAELGVPLVIKVPDGSFSAAVFRVPDRADFAERVPPLLDRSPLLVAQAFLPTAYDWRVGVLDGRVLWVARYHMVPGHWQIRALRGSSVRFGRVEAVPRDRAPRAVLRLAVEAAGLIGDGLFGVDLKETAEGPVVIEVNDNPNLDLGYEDAAEGDRIYEELVRWYLRRLQAAEVRAPRRAPPAPGRGRVHDDGLAELRRPIGRVPAARTFGAYEVVGLELEYALVDRDLNALPVAEEALAALSGRPCSDVELGAFGASNELFRHVLEVKNVVPHRRLVRAEADLVEGVRRLALLLDRELRARLLPGGMHPWLDPRTARRWQRSNRRIYDAYERHFELQTHGWANVQAVHVNLPLGDAAEATAMLNAARLLVPYLPALAASSPMVEGELTGRVDNRVAWLLEHQARLPESMARLVPEPLARLADYRRDVLGPMYAAVDRLPGAQALRAEFLNARGAVFKTSRQSMEIRILDVQECVRADVAVAWFVRRALRWLAGRAAALPPAPQAVLEADLLATAVGGGQARVRAPFLPDHGRAADGTVAAREVLAWLLEAVDHRVPAEERAYAELVAGIVARGSLSEAILRRLSPLAEAATHPAGEEAFTEEARRLWIELADCLVENRPWAGREA